MWVHVSALGGGGGGGARESMDGKQQWHRIDQYKEGAIYDDFSCREHSHRVRARLGIRGWWVGGGGVTDVTNSLFRDKDGKSRSPEQLPWARSRGKSIPDSALRSCSWRNLLPLITETNFRNNSHKPAHSDQGSDGP